MSCARYRALISRYLDGELTPRQRADLLHHIETCASCSSALAKYRQSEVLLKRLPESRTPTDLKRSVMREARRNRRPRGWRRLPWLLGGGRVTARLAGLVVLAVLAALTGLVILPRRDSADGASLLFVPPATATPSYIVPPTDTPEPVAQPVAPPRLIASEPSQDATTVDSAAALLLRFDQAMDRRSVEKAFHVDPPTTGQFSWDADNELRFTPEKSGLLRGITYTVSLDPGAFSLTGTGLPAGKVLQFSTLPAPALAAAWPPAGATAVPLTATMVLTFSQPMELGSVGVTIHGPATGGKLAAPPWSVGGDLQWSADGTTAYFQSALPLPPGAATVEVAAGARDKLGGRLPAYSWPFSVAVPQRSATFSGPRLEVLADAPGAEPQISFYAPAETGDKTGPAVDLAAYRLPRAGFESLLPLLLDPVASAVGAPWAPLSTAALPQERTWRPESALVGSPDGSGATQTDFLPREPGLYLLSAAVTGGQGDQKLVLLADTGLIVLADGGHWTVWASRYDNAAIGATRIVLYDQAGTILAENLVDSAGFFHIDLPGGTIPAAAAAVRDGLVGFTLIDRSRVTPTVQQAPGALVLTDQAAYRPGDIFNFKAFLPGAGGDRSAIVAVDLLDPQGRSIGQQQLKADKLGAFSGSFALAAGAQPGRYSLQLGAGNESFTQPVRVLPATNSAAALALSTSFSSANVQAGQPFSATIRAAYSAASPAAVLPITATLRSASGAALGVYTGTTGVDGLLAFALQAPARPDSDRLYLQATAGGAVGGATFAALPLAQGDLTLTQQLSAYSFAPGQTLTVTATLRDKSGQPLAGRDLTLVLAARSGDNAPDRQLASVRLPTNVAGTVEAVFPLLLQGSFVISTTPSDTPGQPEARDSLWVFGGQSALWALPFGLASSLQFTPDQPAYAPGGTARLLVQAGEQGSGLLLEQYGDQVVGQQTLTLVATGTVVAVPIPAAPPLTGALHLTVLRFAAPGAAITRADFDLPIIQPAAAQVQIALDHGDGQYAPGQIVQARIALTGTDGAPLAGQVAVALLPADQPNSAGPATTSSGVMNATAQEAIGAANAPAPGITGYWNASLAVGSDGIVTATVPLPSDPQAWRLQAWAFSAAGVSSSAADVQAIAPVAIEWSPVGHLVQGDTANIQAVVRNTYPVTVPLEVRLLAEGGLTLDGTTAGQRSLVLQPGESRTLSWSVGAATASGGRLLLDVGWPAGAGWAAATVRQARQVAVLQYGVQDRQARSGAFRGDEQVGMVLPAGVAPNGTELQITCDPTLTGLLLRAFSVQLDAGRDAGASASAAASRLLANAALRDLANRSLLDPDSLPAAMNSERALDLQFLYAAQDTSGGWAEAPGATPSVAVTARVLRALRLLQGTPADPGLASSEVDASTTQRGILWLRAALRPAPVLPGAAASTDALPAATRAHALYVLALYDAAAEEDARALLGQVADLDPTAQGWLALALSRLGLGPEAALLLNRLALDKPSATASPDADTLITSAVILQALLHADPTGERPNSGDVADVLLGQRSGAGWDGYAAGETLLALAGYAAAHPDSTAPFSYQVFVNGTLLREVQVARGSGPLQVVVPGAALHTGQNSVRLQSSDGRIYYSLLARTMLFSETRPISSDADRAFDGSLLRGYQPDGAALTPAVGDLVTVVNTITLGSALGPLQFSDRLPGALESLGDYTLAPLTSGGITTTPAIGATDGLAVLTAAPGDTQLILPALPPGTYRLTYRAIVAHSGNYTALPATLMPAGATPILARSATAELQVTK